MPERLLEAVQELTKVVKQLDQTLHSDFPKRSEVERKFVTKKQSRSNVKLLVFAIMASLVGSAFITSGTLSYCFLGGTESGGPGERFCSIMPGYDEAVDENRDIIVEFRRLQQITEKNKHRIARLEKRN